MKHKILLVLVCALAAGLSSACDHCSDQDSAPPIVVRVHDTAPLNAGSEAGYSANIQPYTQVSLAFQVNGYVQTIAQCAELTVKCATFTAAIS